MKRDKKPLTASTVFAAWQSYRLAAVGVDDRHKQAFIAGAVWSLGKTKDNSDKLLKSAISMLAAAPTARSAK